MDQEVINLPPVTTGIALSSGAIQLLTHCIANCPLTEAQRANLNNEFIAAIKAAIAPERVSDDESQADVDIRAQEQA